MSFSSSDAACPYAFSSHLSSSRNRESAPFGRDLGNHLKRPFDFYFGHNNVISSEPNHTIV
jgi:hypothetical protein